MTDSRKEFEDEVTKRVRSLEHLFKVFARKDDGSYMRNEIEDMWIGWRMHEQHSAVGKSVEESK